MNTLVGSLAEEIRDGGTLTVQSEEEQQEGPRYMWVPAEHWLQALVSFADLCVFL